MLKAYFYIKFYHTSLRQNYQYLKFSLVYVKYRKKNLQKNENRFYFCHKIASFSFQIKYLFNYKLIKLFGINKNRISSSVLIIRTNIYPLKRVLLSRCCLLFRF